MGSILWLFVGVFLILGAIVIVCSLDADRELKITSYILSCIPFGGAIYFILIAFKIVKVINFFPLS